MARHPAGRDSARVQAALATALLCALALQEGPHARELASHRGDAQPPWTFAATGAASSTRDAPQLSARVYGYLPWWSGLDSSFRWDLVSDVIVFSAELTASGDVSDWHRWPSPALVAAAHARNVRVHLCATLFGSAGGGEIASFLSSAPARARAAAALVEAVARGGGDGLNLDFELVPRASRRAFARFVEEVAVALRAQGGGLELTISVPGSVRYRGYDPARLAASARLLLMEYDQHSRASLRTGPVAALTSGGVWADAVEPDVQGWIAAIAPAPPSALALGVPYYGYAWPSATRSPGALTLGEGTPVRLRDASRLAARHGRFWDLASQTPWTAWPSGGVEHQLWYADGQSLSLEYASARAQGLAGVMIWALGYDAGSAEAWTALEEAFAPQPGGGGRGASPGPGSADEAAGFGCSAAGSVGLWPWPLFAWVTALRWLRSRTPSHPPR